MQILTRIANNVFFKDSFWSLLGNIVNKGLALAAGVIIARWLGKDCYGEYGVIKNTLVYIAVFSTFGLGFTATKYVAQYKDTCKEKICEVIVSAILVTLAFSGLMAFLLLIFSQEIASFLEIADISYILRLTAITIVFNALSTTQIGILAGLRAFKPLAKINIFIGGIIFLSSIILTYFYSLNGAIIALMISSILNCILNYFLIKKCTVNYPKAFLGLRSTIITITRFSIPIALQESLYSITYWFGTILLLKLSNYGEVGLNAAAAQWAGVILFIPGVLQNVMLSYLSNEKETEHHNKTLKRMIVINFASSFLPFLLVLLFANFIVSIYGNNYEGLSQVLNTAVAATVIRCLIQVYVQEFISIGKTWQLFFIRTLRDVITICLAYILISYFGSKAAFYYNLSFLISSFLCLLTLIIVRKNANFYFSKKKY